jgi:uncharacterized protein (TIGR01244 family)
MFIRLTETVSVAGQIDPADVAAAAAEGFVTIVNNRPDGEAPDQPPGETIRAAAEAAGLTYVAIPVGQGGFDMGMVDAMGAALAGGKTLAFCRSGTRSTNLWALAEAKRGAPAADIVATAAGGGYDIRGLVPTLRELGAG